MTIALKNEIKRIARQSVREALAEEFAKARAFSLPNVSIKEQKEIEKLYRGPLHRAIRTIKVRI